MRSIENLKPSASAEMGLLKVLFLAARPKTLPASLSPVLLGLTYAYTFQESLNWPIAIITIVCSLLLQISSNFINDYLDFKSGVDKGDRLGPMRVTSAGLISPNQMKQAIIVTMTMAFILGLSLMNWGGLPIVIIGLSSLLGAYLYTGGPFPLSHLALGEVAAFIFFGPVAVWGTFFLQTHQYVWSPIWVGCIPGLFSAAIMSINNLRDRENDKHNGKTTVMTLLSERSARSLSATLIISPIFAMLILSILYNRAFALGFIALIKVRPNMMFILQEKIDARLNMCLETTGKFLFISTLAICLGLLFL